MSRLQANLLLLVAAAIWGSTFVVQHVAMDTIGPHVFTGARFFLGALVVLPLALRELRRLKARGETPLPWHFIGMALAGGALFTGAILQQIGIIHTTVTNAGFLTALYVPTVPLLAMILFRKAPHWAVWPAAFGCLGGTYLLSGGGGEINLQVGDLWVISSAFFWAWHVVLVGVVAARSRAPLCLATIQFFTASALGWICAFVTEDVTLTALMDASLGIAYAGFLSVGVGFTLQVIGQRHTEPADAAILLSMEAVFAAVAGAIFLAERLAPVELIGCAIILACVLAVEVLPLLWRRRKTATA